jgi:hypothetical protein
MRKGLLIVAMITALFIFSCKKERSFDANSSGGGGTTSGNLLSKIVTHLGGNDSVTIFYDYDNQKRLVSYNYDGISNGDAFTGQFKFVRNAQGIIQKVIIKSDELAASGFDSVANVVRYNTTLARYTSTLFVFDDAGLFLKDSTAFTYNASGKLIQSEEFLDNGFTGGYAETTKTEYSYDAAGNVTRVKNYLFNDVTGLYEPYDEDIYEYDAKSNPLMVGNEAFLLGDPTLASVNNVIKDTYTDFGDPNFNDVITTTYTYNSSNKPITSTATYQSEGIPYPTSYTYK